MYLKRINSQRMKNSVIEYIYNYDKKKLCYKTILFYLKKNYIIALDTWLEVNIEWDD